MVCGQQYPNTVSYAIPRACHTPRAAHAVGAPDVDDAWHRRRLIHHTVTAQEEPIDALRVLNLDVIR